MAALDGVIPTVMLVPFAPLGRRRCPEIVTSDVERNFRLQLQAWRTPWEESLPVSSVECLTRSSGSSSVSHGPRLDCSASGIDNVDMGQPV
jgi:hypothetical protein